MCCLTSHRSRMKAVYRLKIGLYWDLSVRFRFPNFLSLANLDVPSLLSRGKILLDIVLNSDHGYITLAV